MDHFYDTICRFNPARFYHPQSAHARAAVGVSACLTGQQVRYDGRDCYLPGIEALVAALDLTPICPEVGAGLPVPRPPVQLIANDSGSQPRARGRDDSSLDVTQQLLDFAHLSVTRAAAQSALCGYLWKSRSPSCGFNSTPLFDASGTQIGQTSGIQAAHFQRAMPWLSFCEESTLIDRRAALTFVLRCRLVFDWMYTGDVELLTQHRHYRFLIDSFANSDQIAVSEFAETNHKVNYLTALQHGCAGLQPGQLLELFI
jgi:uncharacterized protein YbbK (DUF523 family)